MDAKEREILINRLRDIGNDTIERQREEGPQCEAYYQRSIDALTLAIAALEREHAERWRSVEDEVPEIGRAVWTETAGGLNYLLVRMDDRWVDLNGRSFQTATVTAWRPLPEPAKEQEQ